MSRSTAVALWLVPASPWHERFGALIGELAREFDAVVFEPHITLHVGTLRDPSRVSKRLAPAVASRQPMTLVCGATMHDSEHFRTLFVPFDDRRVDDLRDVLRNAIDLRGDYALHLHLSLLYRGGLDVGERRRLAATHCFEGEAVTFDEVVLVRPAAQSGDLFDIRGLDTRQRHRLIGSH
jgi:hypothetical protein